MSVLIVGYRRGEEIRKCIQHVKALQPEKIYIAMDGPKDQKANILCKDARIKAINSVDWECKINTLFSHKNIGAGKFMIKALDWFFKNESHGLILEDDVLIHPEFIEFAKHFFNKPNIGCISSCTFEDKLSINFDKSSVGFITLIPSIWGWYGSKKIWDKFRESKRRKSNPIFYFKKLRRKIGFWQSLVFAFCLEYIDQGKLVGWDYEFAYFLICNNKKIIFPRICMSQNIGNSELAEHCENLIEISPEISQESIKDWNFKNELKENHHYMKKQTLNIMMKKEYKIQAIKGLIKYLIKSFLKSIF